MRRLGTFRLAACTLLAGAALAPGAALGFVRTDVVVQSTFTSTLFASGAGITHQASGGTETISGPDDITSLDGNIFVGFQNGVGPQGQVSSTGNLDSTVVEFNAQGAELEQWDILGKCDGLTADPALRGVIATVNEDANSALYVIQPQGGAIPFSYDRALPSAGGTDAITIHDGMILISASAPGTTGAPAPQPYYPAVYRTTLDFRTRIATIRPLFYDEALATVANTDTDYFFPQRLALTDPDSNENVPLFASRFAGDFMLTSQGDQEQIFVADAGGSDQSLSVLRLSASVDDTAWPSDATGTLYTTDNSDNGIYAITGPFQRGQVLAAETPCDENTAPAICPAPGYPPNFLAQLNPGTGVLTPVTLNGPQPQAQGLLFMP